MISKQEALKLFRELMGPGLIIYSAGDKLNPSWQISVEWTDCWFINYCRPLENRMNTSTRLLVISKETGDVLYSGWAFDS